METIYSMIGIDGIMDQDMALIKCPNCGKSETELLSKLSYLDGDWRFRCLNCGCEFSILYAPEPEKRQIMTRGNRSSKPVSRVLYPSHSEGW